MSFLDQLRNSTLPKNAKQSAPCPWPIDVVWLWCGFPESCHCRYSEDLKFSMRSVTQNIPWFRHLILVVQDDFAIPFWMRQDYNKSRLKIVRVSSILPREYVPNNNYHVLQSWLWRIKSLSDHFIYLHDDMYIARPTPWTCFFTPTGKPINRHYPGAFDHGIHVDHRIPYVRMWVNAIKKYNIHNTRIQLQAFPYRKSLLQKYYKQYKEQVDASSRIRVVSGEQDFDLLRFTSAITSSSGEAIMVQTDHYDWKDHPTKAKLVDYFVESDDVPGIKNLYKAKPRFFIINNSHPIYSHVYSTLARIFPKQSEFEVKV